MLFAIVFASCAVLCLQKDGGKEKLSGNMARVCEMVCVCMRVYGERERERERGRFHKIDVYVQSIQF